MNGSIKIIELLCDYRARLDIKDEIGNTPLHYFNYIHKSDFLRLLSKYAHLFTKIDCVTELLEFHSKDQSFV